ncbi:hypothetical protein ACHFJ0_17860 [Paracoccus sp. NGMCC 1.201697]|uniref:PepSY domain-containing protein n=1 Tax=Paracoccus broussonetiae subsp. drimophilus TaxID=3373869 RepID=A0ABW7LTF2_9RHOB
MFMNPLKIALIAALPLLAAGPAMASTSARTATVSVIRDYSVKQPATATDHALTDQLQRQGFQDVGLMRDGNQIQVTGTRHGEELTLLYDGMHGRLTDVNGQPALMQQMQQDAQTGRGSPGDDR